MKLEKAYLEQFWVLSIEVKDHDRKVEECDKDFIQHTASRKKSLKTLIKKVYTKRKPFLWGVKQDTIINTIKEILLTNVVAGPNLKL